MSNELILCEEPGPAKNDLPCMLEKNHKGEHYTWHQMKNHHVWVFTFEGERIAHIQCTGKVTAEEVCVMVAFLELAAEKK